MAIMLFPWTRNFYSIVSLHPGVKIGTSDQMLGETL